MHVPQRLLIHFSLCGGKTLTGQSFQPCICIVLNPKPLLPHPRAALFLCSGKERSTTEAPGIRQVLPHSGPHLSPSEPVARIWGAQRGFSSQVAWRVLLSWGYKITHTSHMRGLESSYKLQPHCTDEKIGFGMDLVVEREGQLSVLADKHVQSREFLINFRF